MKTKSAPLIIANWKMNPATSGQAITLAKELVKLTKKISGVEIVVAPPSLYIPMVAKGLAKSPIKLSAQHTHPGPVGAFTGEISPAMLKEFGVSYSIVGHSERRALGESKEAINAEILMLLKQKLTPVLCVGEKERDSQANFYSVIETQIASALKGVPATRLRDIVIAYEPVWSIGTGLVPSTADIQEMKLFILKVLTKLSSRQSASAVRVIYGGSVTADSAGRLFKEGEVDGFLVGGASLKAADFTRIITETLKSV